MRKDNIEINGITYIPLYCSCHNCTKYNNTSLPSYWTHQTCGGQIFVGNNARLYCDKCNCETNLQSAVFSCETCDDRGKIKWFVPREVNQSVISTIINGATINSSINVVNWLNGLFKNISEDQNDKDSFKLFMRPITINEASPISIHFDEKLEQMLNDDAENYKHRSPQIKRKSFVKDNVKYVELTFIRENDDEYYHVKGDYYIGSNAHLYTSHGNDLGICVNYKLTKDDKHHIYMCSHIPNQTDENMASWLHLIFSMDQCEFLFVESIMNSLDIH